MAASGSVEASRAEAGFYCSTSGTYFSDKEALADHYRSEFHKYNLKRKVAGLPPVTKEWFEARRAALVSSAAAAEPAAAKMWIEPLTKKKFASENTYQTFIQSKKYLDLVRKSGAPAPPPMVVTKKQEPAEQVEQPQQAPGPAAKPAGFKLVGKGLPKTQEAMQVDGGAQEAEAEEGNESGWETASDEDMEASENWEQWDVCKSLFDNHMSPNFQANLEYMLKNYGFYLPDSQYLRDPEGLLNYLGQKITYGRVPLYVSGEEPNPKQFRSLHAVQRHMVDTNQCKVVYDDNEDEYADFYDYDMGGEDDEGGQQLAALSGITGDAEGGIAGYELVVGGDGTGAGAKVLGTRELAKYYRQRHRPEDGRQSVVVNTMLARYRALGAPTSTDDTRDVETKKAATRAHRSGEAYRMKMGCITSILKKLPKNCPY